MEKIDRHRGNPEQGQHEKRRNDDDAAFEAEDGHRCSNCGPPLRRKSPAREARKRPGARRKRQSRPAGKNCRRCDQVESRPEPKNDKTLGIIQEKKLRIFSEKRDPACLNWLFLFSFFGDASIE
jgi:hypothetical protein